jgi:hypothetical protein
MYLFYIRRKDNHDTRTDHRTLQNPAVLKPPRKEAEESPQPGNGSSDSDQVRPDHSGYECVRTDRKLNQKP